MKLKVKDPNTNEWHEIKPFNPNICLIQELLQVCIEKNETTEHDVFFEFMGHVNAVRVYYYENGFDSNKSPVSIGKHLIASFDEYEIKQAIQAIKELV